MKIWPWVSSAPGQSDYKSEESLPLALNGLVSILSYQAPDCLADRPLNDVLWYHVVIHEGAEDLQYASAEHQQAATELFYAATSLRCRTAELLMPA